MMHKRTQRWSGWSGCCGCRVLCAAAAALLVAQTGLSQVYQTQSGRTLDVNIATSPWNSSNSIVRPETYGGGNLYVTGQVTGGFAFRGNTPYYGANQLRLSLPTETVDNFVRDSVGLNSVQGGMSYRPQAYFSSSRDAYMIGQAGAGAASRYAAGEAYPGAGQRRELGPVYSDRISENYTTQLSPQTTAGILSSLSRAAGGSAASLTRRDASWNYRTDAASGAWRPQYSTLYGYMSPGQQERLGTLMYAANETAGRLESPDQSAATATTYERLDQQVANQPAGEIRSVVRRTDAAAIERRETAGATDPGRRAAESLLPEYEIFRPTAAVEADEPATLDTPADQARPGAREFDATRPEAAQPGRAEVENLLALGGGDMFVGVLMAMRRQESAAGGPESLAERPADAPNRDLPRAVQVDGAVLDRLGGSRSDRFNRLMAAGDELMGRGEYYQAATRYELAGRVGRRNPLAELGGFLAYLAAGESYRAGRYLENALAIYPDLPRVRVDLDRLMGGELAARRTEQLRQRLKDDPAAATQGPSLLAMAFLDHNAGRAEQARQWAAALAELPDAGLAERLFARMLLGDDEDADIRDTTRDTLRGALDATGAAAGASALR